jgi:hypothetical protein
MLRTYMFDAVLENCIFYISPMYEFSHSLGQDRNLKGEPVGAAGRRE